MHEDVLGAGRGEDGVALCDAVHEVGHEVHVELDLWELVLQLLHARQGCG